MLPVTGRAPTLDVCSQPGLIAPREWAARKLVPVLVVPQVLRGTDAEPHTLDTRGLHTCLLLDAPFRPRPDGEFGVDFLLPALRVGGRGFYRRHSSRVRFFLTSRTRRLPSSLVVAHGVRTCKVNVSQSDCPKRYGPHWYPPIAIGYFNRFPVLPCPPNPLGIPLGGRGEKWWCLTVFRPSRE